jgi:hypothetical protein
MAGAASLLWLEYLASTSRRMPAATYHMLTKQPLVKDSEPVQQDSMRATFSVMRRTLGSVSSSTYDRF